MKKIVEKEVDVCDVCGKEGYTTKCLGCGKEFCWDCRGIHVVEYNKSLWLRGSGDGYFCLACDKKPPNKVKILHELYVSLKNLRMKYEKVNEEIDKQGEILKKEIEKIIGE